MVEQPPSFSWPTSKGDPIGPVWSYGDKKGMYQAEALRAFAHDLVESIKEFQLPVREAMRAAGGDGLDAFAYCRMLQRRLEGKELEIERLQRELEEEKRTTECCRNAQAQDEEIETLKKQLSARLQQIEELRMAERLNVESVARLQQERDELKRDNERQAETLKAQIAMSARQWKAGHDAARSTQPPSVSLLVRVHDQMIAAYDRIRSYPPESNGASEAAAELPLLQAQWNALCRAAVTKAEPPSPSRCYCGAHEWPPNCVQIEDSCHRLHTQRGCQPGASETKAKPPKATQYTTVELMAAFERQDFASNAVFYGPPVTKEPARLTASEERSFTKVFENSPRRITGETNGDRNG